MSADSKKNTPLRGSERISIGELASRTGMSVSAIRFYEENGLVNATRNAGGHRRFTRSTIRRLSFILIAQQMGFTLEQIRRQLSNLPNERTPTQKDWQKIGKDFRKELDERLATLTRFRDRLDGCIGCGCLSLKRCSLYNPEDKAAMTGSGPRFVLAEPES